jgi:hypothetical protein
MEVGKLSGFNIKAAKSSVEHVDVVLSLETSAVRIHVWSWLVD